MLVFILGLALILTVLWETFETIILPRRIRRRFRLTRVYYRKTWRFWFNLANRIRKKPRRDTILSYYGPLSLLGLLALWAFALVLGFGMLHHGLGSPLQADRESPDFGLDIYFSGTSFFTLGLGDIRPVTRIARILTVLEAGIGFGFLAIVIGYLPVIYQAFSRREVIISMLDARAGSPPTAVELLKRHAEGHRLDALDALLRDWELWSAELLESHLSYPVLVYFRSQHDNESWLAALTTILDACAVVMAGLKGHSPSQARLTFAIARHTVVDLSQVFDTRPLHSKRMADDDINELHAALRQMGLEPDDPEGRHLKHLRGMYEPYVEALSRFLHMELPPWQAATRRKDNWQTTAWESSVD